MTKTISHSEQQKIWEAEHQNPYVLLPMDSDKPSSGIVRFWQWLTQQSQADHLHGIEMGCGKGRNSIWLAKQKVNMTGFDFSRAAVAEAQKRAQAANVVKQVQFVVQDATLPWPFDDNIFDFAVDCFASTDIESAVGRAFARDEMLRALKPNGYLFVYTLSIDDAFHKTMLTESPAQEKNAFLHPTTGKFEKIFDREELMDFYSEFKLVAEERITKTTQFFGQDYDCRHFWLVFQK